MITSVSEHQGEILRNIITLHLPETEDRFDLDPCYGNGSFYRGPWAIPEPRTKLDVEPRFLDVRQADVTSLDLPSAIVGSAIFDPPYLHAPGVDSVMGERFGGFKNQHALRVMYFAALVELYRVLYAGGVLVVKCQDIIESGRFVPNGVYVVNMAVSLGFEQIDTFILTRKSAMEGHNHADQKHGRRCHCYFHVFKKSKRR